jgi:hypothetical protein
MPDAATTDATKTHPLEPGGERFTEVYASWKTAERELALKDAEIARLHARPAAAAVAAAAPTVFSENQLQAWVDEGKITPAKMAAQLAWQSKEQGKAEMRQEADTARKFASAADEVQAFMAKVPALADERSPDYGRVKRAAFDVADDMGLTIQDPRVQRRALREVFGTLDKADATQGAVDRSRRTDGIPVDGGASGAGGRWSSAGDGALKDVPQAYLQHWERLNYSPEQMAEEAKWITPGIARRSGRRL